MAKLSARGRRELARYERKEARIELLGTSLAERTNHLAFLSDGTILTKTSWRYERDVFAVGGELKSTGWKVLRKSSVETFAAVQLGLEKKGYKEVPVR